MNALQLFSNWSQVRLDLLATIDAFEEDELHYKPMNNGWPVGRIMLHIGDAEAGWIQYIVRKELDEWPKFELETYPDKSAIKEVLADVHSQTETFLESCSLADLDQDIFPPFPGHSDKLSWIIWHVLEHEIHHRGELSLILGLLGRDGLDF